MNLGLVTSYIIAGMILVSMTLMTMNLSTSSSELTMTNMEKQHLDAIAETIIHDIPKIGYDRDAMTDTTIIVADSNKIVFDSNIDNSTDGKVERITWEYTSTDVSGTANPNDYVLMRNVKEKGSTLEKKTPIELGVTRFELKYYNVYGSNTPMSFPISDPGQIKQIEVIVEVQSAEKLNLNKASGNKYVTSQWKKRFSPVNLSN